MDNNRTFKLTKLVINNVKNVESGTIDFTNKGEIMNVVGIYGQNGSGKTTAIESVGLIRSLLLGESISKNAIDLLNVGTESKIIAEFSINHEEIVTYEVALNKSVVTEGKEFEQKRVEKITLVHEILKRKEIKKNAKYSTIIDFERIDEDNLELNPKYRFPMTMANVKRFFSANAKSLDSGSSFIFGKTMASYIKTEAGLDKRSLEVFNMMQRFLPLNIFVYTNKLYGMINEDHLMPILFSYKTENGGMLGTIPLDINKRSAMKPQFFDILSLVIKQINMILPAIIPGIAVDLVDMGRGLNDDGEEVVFVEFVSSRNGKKFPFRCESDGIKKIVSILSAIINLYGSENCIVLIDEFDSGIYEYLLGEIIEILDKNAKGQLIFSSHNLRPLEVLKDNEIVFTTVNPQNRYVRAEKIKKTNNLRNVYIRNIQVGVDGDQLYNETDTFLMKKSFRKAAKTLMSDDISKMEILYEEN